MSTPSQLAIDTCNKMFSGPTAVPIQEALDQACAAKDQRIAELEHQLRCVDSLRVAAKEALAFADNGWKKAAAQNLAMAALLEQMPHSRELSWDKCADGCPACAWAKLKEGK